MAQPLLLGLLTTLPLVPPALASEPTDIPPCLKKPAHHTLASSPGSTVETTLVAQAVAPGPACTFTPVRKPAPVIRGLW